MGTQLCFHCFKTYEEEEACPYCGYVPEDVPSDNKKLPQGAILKSRYLIGRHLHQNWYTHCYLALDYRTMRRVLIQEYFPCIAASRNAPLTVMAKNHFINLDSGPILFKDRDHFEDGLKSFREFARVNAKYDDQVNAVQFLDFFEENGTAYLVRQYIEGTSLNILFSQGKRYTFASICDFLLPIFLLLAKAHKQGDCHGQLVPDQILITPDQTPKLLGLGRSAFEQAEDLNRQLSMDYDPYCWSWEYSLAPYVPCNESGPAADVYAMGVILYEAVTGIKPPNHRKRLFDQEPVNLSDKEINYEESYKAILLKAIAVDPKDRYQNMQEFLDAIMDYEKEMRHYFSDGNGNSRQLGEPPILPETVPDHWPRKLVSRPVQFAAFKSFCINGPSLYEYSEYDCWGRLSKKRVEDYHDSDNSGYTLYQYNRYGSEDLAVSYNTRGIPTGWKENTRFPHDRLLVASQKKVDIIQKHNIYHYESDGSYSTTTTIERKYENTPDSELTLVSCRYSSDGNLSEKTEMPVSGPVLVTAYTYENGVLTEEICSQKDGKEISRQQYQYDAQGNLFLRREKLQSDPPQINEYHYNNTYDADGFLTHVECSVNSQIEFYQKYEIVETPILPGASSEKKG